MRFVQALRHLLAGKAFRRLFTVRIVGQVSDGLFQAGLAAYVLFSPERETSANAIAAGLAVLLLPFSLLGPFVGVFLDRWRRRQVLVAANALRVLPVLATAAAIAAGAPDGVVLVTALVEIGLNRFILAGLSAGLPHTVDRNDLVLANAVTPTSGTIAFLAGLGLATALRHAFAPVGDAAVGVVVASALGYGAASLLATRIGKHQLGPDLDDAPAAVRAALRHVLAGLVAGGRHLRERRPAALALGVIAAHRFGYGVMTVATVLLYRYYFNDPRQSDAALAGLSVTVLVAGLGFLFAAFVTPYAAGHLGPATWIVVLLVGAAVTQAFPGSLYTVPAVLVTSFCAGTTAQGSKICVDTLVQLHVDDAYRGRVFALYDVIFNLAFVAAGAVAAPLLPQNGKSFPVLFGVAAIYLLTAAAYALANRHLTVRHALVAPPTS